MSRRFARTAAWHAIVASSSFTRRFDALGALACREIAEQVAHYGSTSLPSSASGIAATEMVVGPRRTSEEAEGLELRRALLGEISFGDPDGDGHRHEQGLRSQAVRLEVALQALVGDPLVCRVHVDDDQAVAVRGEHVDAGELREREAERRDVADRGAAVPRVRAWRR